MKYLCKHSKLKGQRDPRGEVATSKSLRYTGFRGLDSNQFKLASFITKVARSNANQHLDWNNLENCSYLIEWKTGLPWKRTLIVCESLEKCH